MIVTICFAPLVVVCALLLDAYREEQRRRMTFWPVLLVAALL